MPGPTTPNRVYRQIVMLAGHYVSIRNSDLPDWIYPRSARNSGLADYAYKAVLFTQTISLTPGSIKLMSGTTCTIASPTTFTKVSGSASGVAYFELQQDCNVRLTLPTGLTGSCTGPCIMVNAVSPNWTLGSDAEYKYFQLANMPISSGTWGSPDNQQIQLSKYYSEGNQGMIAGYGRGPYLIENNYASGAGTNWHFDDSGAYPQNVSYTLRRNTFDTPGKYLFGHTLSDGYGYEHRNGPEWKHGSQIKIIGNIFNGGQAAVSATGCALVFTGRSGQWVSDAEISYNTFKNMTCAISLSGGVPHADPPNFSKSKVFQHAWIHNNILERIDGWTFFDPAHRTYGIGYPFYIGFGIEDMIVEHNTLFDMRSPDPVIFHYIQSPMEGAKFDNNIFTMANDSGRYGMGSEGTDNNVPSCAAFSSRALMDCLQVRGTAQINYSFSKNLLVPLYTNSSTLTGNMDPAVTTTNFTGLGSFVKADSAVLDRITNTGWFKASLGGLVNNYRLKSTSAYISGGANRSTGGIDLGANINDVEQVQGLIYNVRPTAIGTTTATISFTAPDASVPCYVYYGTGTDVSLFPSSVTNSTASRLRSMNLTGLSSGIKFSYQVFCAGAQNKILSSFVTK